MRVCTYIQPKGNNVCKLRCFSLCIDQGFIIFILPLSIYLSIYLSICLPLFQELWVKFSREEAATVRRLGTLQQRLRQETATVRRLGTLQQRIRQEAATVRRLCTLQVLLRFRAFQVFYKKTPTFQQKIYGLGQSPPLYGHVRKKKVFFYALPNT